MESISILEPEDGDDMLKTITEQDSCFTCCFCKTSTVDDLNLGQLFMYNGVVVHYYCMLFSAALSQHGRDDEGILGFMPQDIASEVRRSFRLKCTFCNVAGASIGCCNKRCRTAFHFPCGLKNGATYQFFGNYESFCAEHVVRQSIHIPEKDWICPICTGHVSDWKEAIMPTCCGSAVFHKECLQKLALSSGYFFKCPMCNNDKEFVHEMRTRGIFVPEQDASWEREPHAFEELYYQHSQCDVAHCCCPKGKDFSAPKGSWALARCRICGANGTHKKCSNLVSTEDWACDTCLNVEQRTEKEKVEKNHEEVPEEFVSPEDTDDVYVSARSGNRKVRNGRLQKRKANSTYWKLSDVVISPSCFWFFPYDKPRLAQFTNQKTLPDWRRLTLRVNLVNWIPKSLFAGAKISSNALPKEDPHDYKLSTTNKTMLKSMGVTEDDAALISDSEIIVHYKATKVTNSKARRKKLGYKGSRWGRGVIEKGKKKKIGAKRIHDSKESTPANFTKQKPPDFTSPTSRWEIASPERIVPPVAVPMEIDESQSANSQVSENESNSSNVSFNSVSSFPTSKELIENKEDAAVSSELPLLTDSSEKLSMVNGSEDTLSSALKLTEVKLNGNVSTPLGTKNELNVPLLDRSVSSLESPPTTGNSTEIIVSGSADVQALKDALQKKLQSNENCHSDDALTNTPSSVNVNHGSTVLQCFKLRSPKDLASATVSAVGSIPAIGMNDLEDTEDKSSTSEAPVVAKAANLSP